MNVFNVLREKLEAFASAGCKKDFDLGSCRNYENCIDCITSKIRDEVDKIEKEYKNGWIPCSEELPPQPKPNPEFECKPLELYLVSMNDSKYPWRAFWNGKDFTDGWRVVYPTAWQPLPPKYEPKGE